MVRGPVALARSASIQRPGQRRDEPQLVVEVEQPFHGQVGPAEVLDALLGDEGQPLVPAIHSSADRASSAAAASPVSSGCP
jgi:hypothetical protein